MRQHPLSATTDTHFQTSPLKLNVLRSHSVQVVALYDEKLHFRSKMKPDFIPLPPQSLLESIANKNQTLVCNTSLLRTGTENECIGIPTEADTFHSVLFPADPWYFL